jgi:hypothetical protein
MPETEVTETLMVLEECCWRSVVRRVLDKWLLILAILAAIAVSALRFSYMKSTPAKIEPTIGPLKRSHRVASPCDPIPWGFYCEE